ncbi:hypothetical protein D3C83_92820 [compost metagenome]
MELHRLADHVRHLVEAPVVHGGEGGEDPALDRLQPIGELGNGPIDDDVARVLEEVPLHERMDRGH